MEETQPKSIAGAVVCLHQTEVAAGENKAKLRRNKAIKAENAKKR